MRFNLRLGKLIAKLGLDIDSQRTLRNYCVWHAI